ncbi:MAG: nucleoside-diphosphate sugar epimerase, partial [Chloroflexota bacterium]
APGAAGDVFNIGSSEEVTIMELAQRVRDRADSASEINLVPYEQAYESGFEDFRRRVPSIDRIRATIGWQPETSLDETIDQVIAFYREEQLNNGRD